MVVQGALTIHVKHIHKVLTKNEFTGWSENANSSVSSLFLCLSSKDETAHWGGGNLMRIKFDSSISFKMNNLTTTESSGNIRILSYTSTLYCSPSFLTFSCPSSLSFFMCVRTLQRVLEAEENGDGFHDDEDFEMDTPKRKNRNRGKVSVRDKTQILHVCVV